MIFHSGNVIYRQVEAMGCNLPFLFIVHKVKRVLRCETNGPYGEDDRCAVSFQTLGRT